MPTEADPIARVQNIDREHFQKQFARPAVPCVIEQLSHSWPAYTKWTLEYFKSICGDKVVPLYDSSKADSSKKVNQPDHQMKFGDYLDLVAREPTDLRIFTFNVADEMPQLENDYAKPDLCGFFLDRFPMLFFGGAGSKVFMHYDIDLPRIFLTQFQGSKRVLLFPPSARPRMYKLPLSWHALEDIDWWDPDYAKYPALKGLRGYTTILKHGETLFMPPGWWHYMEYLEGGFAIAMRAVGSPLRAAEGALNVGVLRVVDNVLRKRGGKKWFDFKERRAQERSNKWAARHGLIGAQ